MTLRSLPKNLLQDQEAFWTLPFHANTSDLSFVVPAAFGTALLIGSDTYIEPHLPQSPSTVSHAATASTAGMLALLGTGGGLFLWGQATHDERKSETGLLAGEAAIDAYAITTAFKYMTQRERPYTGNGKGSFFYGGDSFPSDTAAVGWATASVIAHEYPGFMTKLLAYGVAGSVTAGRIIGQKHWTSDAVFGSALGWYLGRQVYRARTTGSEINASTGVVLRRHQTQAITILPTWERPISRWIAGSILPLTGSPHWDTFRARYWRSVRGPAWRAQGWCSKRENKFVNELPTMTESPPRSLDKS